MEAGYNPAVVMTEKESTSANSFAVRCKKAKHGTARHSASNRSGPAVNDTKRPGKAKEGLLRYYPLNYTMRLAMREKRHRVF